MPGTQKLSQKPMTGEIIGPKEKACVGNLLLFC